MIAIPPRPLSFVAGLFLCLLIVAVAGRAGAEPVFAFATTPGKLPKTVVPVHYDLDLKPDLDKLAFTGAEVIDIDVAEPTESLVVNAVDLMIEKAAIDGDAVPAAALTLDAAAETLTLVPPRPIGAGRHRLSIAYTGRINRFGRGLYMVDYPTASGRKRMISSLLEPADARRVFPSFDEPAFKASISLAVTVAQEFLAVSNMPVAQEESIDLATKRVTFQPTPRMSSYLFVLTAGELERITANVGGVAVGVVATRGKAGQGRYALDSAADLLRYYNDYFGMAYPLPKLDLIAVPGGFGGAMENWGGITFFESRLLFDPAVSAADARRGIFGILAHEMAHQWFGDLVTTAWWDNIWLNEGFASWMASKAAERMHPEWQTWLNFSGRKEAAMSEDAHRTTHPVQQPVGHESEAMAAFDSITYVKGEALIRMLESYLGEDAFAAGIRAYMRRHGFRNATTADLWGALDAASGKPVTAIASAYTEQPGVPLVVAQALCRDGTQRIAMRQERFTVHDPAPVAQHWQVPVMLGGPGRPGSPGSPGAKAGAAAGAVLLDGSAEIAAGRCGEPVKLNLGDVGYYRVQYDDAMLTALAGAVDRFAPADRVNLIADSWAMVEAGRAAPGAFFDFADRLAADDNRAVADEIIRIFFRVDRLQRSRPGRTAFQAYARAALQPAFRRFGWDAAPGEGADDALLRARVLGALGAFGDEAVIAEAKRRFAAFVQDPASLPTDLRGTIVNLAGHVADRATYDTLLALARKTTNTGERVRYYSAAAGALDPALARETLALALTEDLPSSLVGTLISRVAGDGEHPDLAWSFVQANFEALATRQGPSFRETFASNLMTNFTDAAHAAELARFAPVHETSGGRQIADRAQERIMTDAEFSGRQLPAIDDWVRNRAAR
jgi:aminopeptidase N